MFQRKTLLIAVVVLSVLLAASALLTVPPDSYTRFMVYIPGGRVEIGDDIESSRYTARIDRYLIAPCETTNREVVDIYNRALAWKLAEIRGKSVWVHPETGILLQFPLLDTAIAGSGILIRDDELAVVPGTEHLPACGVSWYGAAMYCNYLSRIEGFDEVYDTIDWTPVKNARGYRLPEYEEWEWAARGGEKSEGYRYAGSDDPLEVGWFKENSGGTAHPVAKKRPNELGLYDMSGNLHEFMSEVWDPLRTMKYKPDESGFVSGGLLTSGRIWRGGAWNKQPVSVYFFRQNINQPDYCLPWSDIGFRIVFTRPALSLRIRSFFRPVPALPPM